jgi:PAS domain S-box-containing protein
VTPVRLAEQKLHEKDRYLADILNALPVAVYTTDAQGRITYFNEEAVSMAGRVPELGKDEWCVTWRLRDQDGAHLPHSECPMAIALKEDRPVRGVVAYAERPDGKLIPFTPYPTPLHDGSGRLIGGINMLVDITEQKKREEQIEFVMHELSHRSKNLLAIVMAIANRTVRSCSDLEEFAPKFMKRIEAMARSHDLLVQNSWAGADIRDIVRSEISRFLDGDGEERAAINGNSIMLAPSVAQNLSLAVHELATNAVKHGALARDGGSIEIEWKESEGNTIAFAWRERVTLGNPKQVSEGFGTQVLSSVFRKPEIRLTPSGLNFSGFLEHARPQALPVKQEVGAHLPR